MGCDNVFRISVLLCASRRSALSQGVLAAMTEMRMPPLMGAVGSADDWSGALSAEREGAVPPEVLELYATFQEELSRMATDCDAWNDAATERAWPDGWPIYTSHPALLELSVSL